MATNVKSITLSSGHLMPMVGLGTWKSKPGEVEESVKCAIDCGYRHIDCAFVYGNEAEVGTALKAKLGSGAVKREDLFITSKLWNTQHAANDVQPACKKTLELLGLDYLDLYLIHWPSAWKPGVENFPKDDEGNLQYTDTSYLETWQAMEQLVKSGLVRSIGLSNFNSAQVQDVLQKSTIKPAVNQIEVHPYMSQEKLTRFCQERQVAVTAYSPFASPDRPWASADEPVLLDDPQLKSLAEKYNKTPAQVVLRWLLQRNIIVIPKSVTPSRIKSNLEVNDFELSADDMELVNSFNRDARLVAPYVTRNGKREFRDKDAPNFPFNIEF